jgi:WD40 repeat protein
LPDGSAAPEISVDGTRLAAIAAADHTAVVWNIDDQTVLSRFRCESQTADGATLAFDPSGKHLAVRTKRRLEIWNVEPPKLLRSLPAGDHPRGKPAFSSDGRLLACGTEHGLIRVWDLGRGQLLHSLAGHSGSVNQLAFAPDGRHVASTGADQTVRLWDLEQGIESLRLRGHQGRSGCLLFPASGSYLVSGSDQPAEIKFWDLSRQQEFVSIPDSDRASRIVEGLAFGPDGTEIQAIRKSGMLQVSDSRTGVELRAAPLDFGGRWRVPAALAAFSADGRIVAHASGTDARVVNVIDLATGKTLQRFQHSAEVLHIALSGNGRTVAASAHDFKDPSSRREVRVWNVETGELRAAIQTQPFFTNHIFGCVALSSGGELLAYDEYFPTGKLPVEEHARIQVKIYDLKSAQVVRALEGAPSLVRALSFSPDARYLAMACDRGGILVHDRWTDRWQPDQPLTGSAFDAFTDLAYSPDGRRLAAAGHLQTQMWDSATGNAVLTLRGAPPRPKDVGFNPRIAWSPDGQRLAASHWNKTVSVWSAELRSARGIAGPPANGR